MPEDGTVKCTRCGTEATWSEEAQDYVCDCYPDSPVRDQPEEFIHEEDRSISYDEWVRACLGSLRAITGDRTFKVPREDDPEDRP